MRAPLVARILLDAQGEFARAAAHVPAAGRGGPPGRLNSAGWIVAHSGDALDGWMNVLGQGLERDHWLAEHGPRYGAPPVDPPFDGARGAYDRVVERSAPYLESCDQGELARVPDYPERSFWRGQQLVHLVARAVAHLFVHAGELTVIASLLGRDDLGLPGALSRSTESGGEEMTPSERPPSEGRPLVVRMLLDAREQVARVADAVPPPAQAGEFAELNSGGRTVAHLAQQDDRYWNVDAQGLEPDAWLADAGVGFGDPASKPDYAEARAALDRSYARTQPYLERIDGSELDRVVRRSRAPGRSDQTVSDLAVRQMAHYFATAGELLAIASLAGADDLGLPGEMAQTRGGGA